jgi:hypothetical protein
MVMGNKGSNLDSRTYRHDFLFSATMKLSYQSVLQHYKWDNGI